MLPDNVSAGVVEADNVVAFYPTRYDIEYVAANIVCPVAAFFARNDELPGATVDDACALREGLLNNDKVCRQLNDIVCIRCVQVNRSGSNDGVVSDWPEVGEYRELSYS